MICSVRLCRGWYRSSEYDACITEAYLREMGAKEAFSDVG